MRWLLLLCTLVSVWITWDAIRWQIGAKDIPFSVLSRLWKGGLEHLPGHEREVLRKRYRSTLFGIGGFVLVFAAATVALIVVTIREFLR